MAAGFEYAPNSAVFGEGCVVFVFPGPIEGRGSMPSFRARATSGGRPATFFIAGDRDAFSDLREGQAYVCAEAKPFLPQVQAGSSTWGSRALPRPRLASV